MTYLAQQMTADLFTTPEGKPYITLTIAGVRQTHPLSEIGGMLRQWYYRHHHLTIAPAVLAHVLALLDAEARYGGSVHEVHIRIAGHDGEIFIDLGDPQWRAIRVRPGTWFEIVDNPPVRFERVPGMLPLPMPIRNGNIRELLPFVNVSDGEFPLLVGFTVNAFRPTGPYLILILSGGHGSAKTTTAKVVRQLLDPRRIPHKSLPASERDLMIAARRHRVLSFDNLSRLSDAQSDALCRIATEGGFGTRALRSDDEEVELRAELPIILNGIGDIATRPDLLDRAILLTLPEIPDNQRLPETEFWAAFDAAYPRILGALLNRVALALRDADAVRQIVPSLPRMADAVVFATAAEPPRYRGAFLDEYRQNRLSINTVAIEQSPIVEPLRRLLQAQPERRWSGSPSDLLQQLVQHVEPAESRQAGWPKIPNRLSNELNRIAPNLRYLGITMTTHRMTAARVITIVMDDATESDHDGRGNDVGGNDARGESVVTASSADQTSMTDAVVPVVPAPREDTASS